MPIHIQGDLLVGDESFAIVVSRFNEIITRRLLDGALETFRRHGGQEDRLTVVWVPGSFEIPLVARRLAQSRRYHAVCCLGAVIQGETTHNEYINHQVARGLMQAGETTGVPVLFGILTCQTLEQGLERAGGKAGNKGAEAALAAIEMAHVLSKLTEEGH